MYKEKFTFYTFNFAQQVNKLVLTPDLKYIAAGGNPQVKFFDINGNSQSAVSY